VLHGAANDGHGRSMTGPRHGTEGLQLLDAPRDRFDRSGRDGRLRFEDRVSGVHWRRQLWGARRTVTSKSHLRTATNRGDRSFLAPGVSGARNEWSRTTAPSASTVVSRGEPVRKPPSRDNDLTVKSVVCVFGTTRRAEDDRRHLRASHTTGHLDRSHRGETGSVALNGERPIHHRA
jgi:hypothetical protein